MWLDAETGCTLTGSFLRPDGSPRSGELFRLRPSPGALKTISTNVDLATEEFYVTLSVDGKIRGLDGNGTSEGLLVPATNYADITPQGWTYFFHPSWVGGKSFSFAAPQGQVVNLVSVSPVAESAGIAVIQGPPGPAGPPGMSGNATVVEVVNRPDILIVHNFGYFPVVGVTDASGTEWTTDVHHMDTNSVYISFASNFTGFATLV